jgi:hypothetical protein
MRLAEVLRRFGPAYRARFGNHMLPSHRRAINDIVACRTPACGAHLELCDACGHRRLYTHSCRNRHCPTCQGDRARRWVDRHLRLLLPCPYYLITVTLPASLRRLARSHQRVVYDLLIREAANAVLDLCADPRWVGARPPMLAVLHTWARNLAYHLHVHLLVSSGGLSPDRHAWTKPANPRFLMPGYCLELRVRNRLRSAFAAADILTGDQAWTTPWVVHVKRLRCGEHALRYLSRYLFRVAISDHAIEWTTQRRVSFRWTDSRTGVVKRSNLAPHDFIARFLDHVLPRGFVKVRTYGLRASACRHQLDLARHILDAHRGALAHLPAPQPPHPEPTIASPRECPVCHAGRMVTVAIFPRPRSPP